MVRLERSSRLASAPEAVWVAATSPAEINDELRPLLRMTIPARVRELPLDRFPLGESIGRCWILLGGVLPIDFDDLCLAELEPDPPRRRFLERSRTLAFSVWEHERTVEADGDGCRVSDRLGFELRPGLRRVPGVGRLAAAIVGLLFSHRHRRLRRR